MSSLVVLQHSEADRIEILQKYGRTVETVKDDIKSVIHWLEKMPHLPEIPSAKVIERFLILNKFRVEETKQKIDMYYSIRSLVPEFYDKDANDPAIQKIMETIYIVPLPKLTIKLQRIIILKLKDYDVDNFDPLAVFGHAFHIGEVRLREECALSDIYIYDLNGARMGHLLKFTPSMLKKFAFVFERALSHRTDGIHFINAPAFIESVLSLIATYFKPKVAKRVFVHKGIEAIRQIVKKGSLPKDFGGDEKSLKELQDQWKQKFIEYNSLYQYLFSIKVKEEMRVGKLQADDLLGIDGNFRLLNVD